MTTVVLLLLAVVGAGNLLESALIGAPLRVAASAAALGLELPLVDPSRRSAAPNRWVKPTPSGTRSRTDSAGAPASSAPGLPLPAPPRPHIWTAPASGSAAAVSHATLDMDSAKPEPRAPMQKRWSRLIELLTSECE